MLSTTRNQLRTLKNQWSRCSKTTRNMFTKLPIRKHSSSKGSLGNIRFEWARVEQTGLPWWQMEKGTARHSENFTGNNEQWSPGERNMIQWVNWTTSLLKNVKSAMNRAHPFTEWNKGILAYTVCPFFQVHGSTLRFALRVKHDWKRNQQTKIWALLSATFK